MIYLIVNKKENFCKIGYSANPQARLMQLQTGNPYPLELVKAIPGDIIKEREIQDLFKHLALQGEWFAYSKEVQAYFEVSKEPVKTYIENMSVLAKCKGAEISIVLATLPLLEYGTNRLHISPIVREQICTTASIKLNTLNAGIAQLVKKNILIKEGSATYLLNPALFFFGSDLDRSKVFELTIQYKIIP